MIKMELVYPTFKLELSHGSAEALFHFLERNYFILNIEEEIAKTILMGQLESYLKASENVS
jgi:hypothetical protein